jgi:NAD+ synthase (glutamine-hydrolysing)
MVVLWVGRQTDEVDMGMTYDELSVFGRLRKISRSGPYSMYRALVEKWHETCGPAEVARKVFAVTDRSLTRDYGSVLTPVQLNRSSTFSVAMPSTATRRQS